MSRIDELIAALCPEGVGFKRLEELGATYGGLTGKSKADFSAGNARFVSYKNIFNNLAVNLDANDFVKVGSEENQNFLVLGDVLFTGSSETPDEVGMSSVVVEKPSEAIYLNSFCFGYRFNNDALLLPTFSKYLFRSYFVRQQIVMCASGVTRFNISKKRFLKVCIPIPSTAIQYEIVKVLDTFTTLEARRRQYQYYRDALLRFGEGRDAATRVRWVTLGEIGSFIRGVGIQKSDFIEFGAGCIHYGQIHTHYGTWADKTKSFIRSDFAARLRKANTGDLVIATTSEDDDAVAKAVAWMGDEEVAVSTDAYIYRHTINAKYVSYFFQTKFFHSQKKPHITGTKVRRISGDSLAKIRIPVPPLEVQARIVAVLDQFDTLVNDITAGLPAEIAARRQQYAYYRDRLLTFKEAV
ncbi:restriction endonuclease subunit S [Xylella fastidiosa]|uniref:restriction endonuclease subunit S n=1 Tax=Xylella fastidiosa TaxID=2371 RepID=UPI000765C900|nr:restriction endonuclease subunit S [Xylella fastidiosa]ALR02897.1 restriction endonuclease [Xylella fastidiosa]KXB11943.1 restriction endonuclease [Xylella fastidiosa]KXB22752.1 restriction endonuclease [Xylella fastidiosa]MDG5823151.1 restriction endonuclease subunit S [Xylella fastidiosa subsp. pauca]NRP68034.1 restriction endonuclease [Xylella fastidiosa]